MSWVKIDDNVSEHPKMIAAGAEASWLWICALTYCNRQKRRTGFIPHAKASLLFPMKNIEEAIQTLLVVGLWETSDGGYQIHDYHAETLSDVRREAGRRGGVRSGKTRQGDHSSVKCVDNNEANEANEAKRSKLLEAKRSKNSDLNEETNVASSSSSSLRERTLNLFVTSENQQHVSPPLSTKNLIAAYFAAFEAARGTKPVFTSRDGKSAKQLVETLGEEGAIAAVKRAFSDPWFVANQATLHAIANNPNRFLGSGGLTGTQDQPSANYRYGNRL